MLRMLEEYVSETLGNYYFHCESYSTEKPKLFRGPRSGNRIVFVHEDGREEIVKDYAKR
jgi:hypothetical protein